MTVSLGKPEPAGGAQQLVGASAALCLEAARNLHRHIAVAHWNGAGLVGPDPGIRFNWRIGRFMKGWLRSWPWKDSLYYLQAQGYWVLANWRLFFQTGEASYREVALRCSEYMLERQRRDGAWDYPNPEWKGRIATSEGTWGSLGLLETYRHTGEDRFLAGALRWHAFLLKEVGFDQVGGEELAVNYFANRHSARIPNNSAFVLRFLAELADVTGERTYLKLCGGMVAFMRGAQKSTGEFPYMVRGTTRGARCWEHFQCYQYNAFQSLDLMRYHDLTGESRAAPLVANCLKFLRTGLAEDGHAFYDCGTRRREFTYHTAALGAAFAEAGRLGFHGYEALGERAFSYVLGLQQPDGTFPCSRREYFLLRDQRSYPRALSMILFHLLVRVQAGSSARVCDCAEERSPGEGRL